MPRPVCLELLSALPTRMTSTQEARTLSPTWSVPHRRKQLRHQPLFVALLFLAPSLLGLFLLQVFPIGTALVLGVSEWNIIDPMEFVGLKNFRDVLTDATFFRSLQNTLYLTAGLEVLNTVLGLAAAMLLRHALRGIGLYRTIYFLPLITTWAAVAIAWRYMYSLDGPINAALAPLGIDPIPWLSRPEWAMPAVIVTITWKTLAWKTIILLAGLQSIPTVYYEASSIDGARKGQQFFRITLPLLSPALFFALIIGIINTLQLFDPIFIMTDGGPADATRTLSYYIYARGFQSLRMGYAAALSWVLFAIILLFTLFQWVLQKRWVFYQ